MATEKMKRSEKIMWNTLSWSAFQNLSGCRSIKVRIKFSNQIQNLDDEEDPEDGDADVGCEEHVESEVETVIEDSGNYLMLISNDQVIQQTNILR